MRYRTEKGRAKKREKAEKEVCGVGEEEESRTNKRDSLKSCD